MTFYQKVFSYFLIIFLLAVNLLVWHSFVIGLTLGLIYFLVTSWLLGQILFSENNISWQTFFGSLFSRRHFPARRACLLCF